MTRDQQRAAHAWRILEQAADEKKLGEDFSRHLKKLPTRILAAGLGQALAYLHNEKAAPVLLAALDDWMHAVRPPADGTRTSLLGRIVRGDAAFLREATDEVLAYLLWLGRFNESR